MRSDPVKIFFIVMAESEDLKPLLELHSRQILLEDGRYMIFFTFGDESDKDASAAEAQIPAEVEEIINV